MNKLQLLFSLGVVILNYSATAQSGGDTQESFSKKQNKSLQKQEAGLKEQEAFIKEQEAMATVQKRVMDALKQELLKDGLIQNDGNNDLIINNREMLINGKKQPESVHHKYIQLIQNKRNKPLGEKEEWKMKI